MEGKNLSKEPIGEILLRRRLIKLEQLEQALEVQRREKKLIGEILVNLRFLSETDIVAAIVIQCGVPYIAINIYQIDPNVVRLIPSEIARAFNCIAVDRAGEVLSVVMADPLNPQILGKLREITHYRIVPYMATKTEIQKTIGHYYG